MLDQSINPDAPTKMEMAVEHHWGELNKAGMTIFSSENEIRYIVRDEIMHETMCDQAPFGLHYDITTNPKDFCSKITTLFENTLNNAMKEALTDYYS